MSTTLFDLFKFSKLLDIKNGKISLMETPVNIIPTSILCGHQKTLIKNLGLEEAYNILYTNSKEGSINYNLSFIKKLGLIELRKIIDWQTKIVSLSGWGEVDIAMVNPKEKNFIAHFKESAFAESYGKEKYAIDFILTGLVAGGLTAATGVDLDAIETKCESMGDQFCEIEVGPADTIENKKIALWEKWGIYKL
jgi:predicted hydrocarbon binding protein